MNPLLETWEIHARINEYLLDAIPASALASASSSGGRTVGEALAHIHNVRLMWLKATAPDLLEGLEKIEKGPGLTPAALKKALKSSTAAIGGRFMVSFWM